MTLRFIDPANCGCTDCCIGEAVPLSSALDRHVRGLLAGRVRSRIGHDTEVTITITTDNLNETVFVFPADELCDRLRDPDVAPIIAGARLAYHTMTVEIGDRTFDV